MSSDDLAERLIEREAQNASLEKELRKIRKELAATKNSLTQYQIRERVANRERNRKAEEEGEKELLESEELREERRKAKQHEEMLESMRQELVQAREEIDLLRHERGEVAVTVSESPTSESPSPSPKFSPPRSSVRTRPLMKSSKKKTKDTKDAKKQTRNMAIFKASKKQHLFSEESEDNDAPKNWTNANCRTVASWKEDCAEMSFIYKHIRDEMLKTISAVTLILLVISIFRETVDVSHLALNETDHPTLSWVIKGTNVFLSSIGLLATGYLRALRITDIADKLKTFLGKLEGFLALLVSETTLPKKLRKDAEEFIVQHKNTYFSLVRDQPDDLQSKYEKAYGFYLQKMETGGTSEVVRKFDQFIAHSNLNSR